MGLDVVPELDASQRDQTDRTRVAVSSLCPSKVHLKLVQILLLPLAGRGGPRGGGRGGRGRGGQ
jgi:hypothetical protein